MFKLRALPRVRQLTELQDSDVPLVTETDVIYSGKRAFQMPSIGREEVQTTPRSECRRQQPAGPCSARAGGAVSPVAALVPAALQAMRHGPGRRSWPPAGPAFRL